MGGVVREVVRALPLAILRPLGGLAQGVSFTLLGLRNHLDPERRTDEEDVFNVDL
ncbi:hypothetical protein EON65_55450 [archaeon]|nr:MAG: hypothetical protein EON65_55450 [archaeon]